MFTQKITNFKTKPYNEYDDYNNPILICNDAKYDSHHAELFNPHTGEVYMEAVDYNQVTINRHGLEETYGYYEQPHKYPRDSGAYYGDYIPQW